MRSLNNGFTLAEVLITLGIIGVVAAITIPALMNNIQDAKYKAAWKKEYSIINQAYQLAKQDEGGDLSTYFIGAFDSMVTIPLIHKMEGYLKTVKSCDVFDTNKNYLLCSSSSINPINYYYKSMSGVKMNQTDLFYYQMQLTDGAIIFSRAATAARTILWVDVNGYNNKPNIIGKDLFGMVMTKDKIMPIGADGSGAENTCNATPAIIAGSYGYAGYDISGAGCSADYLYK